MFRSLIPLTVALLVAPTVALAAPEDKPAHADEAAPGPEAAERGSGKSERGSRGGASRKSGSSRKTTGQGSPRDGGGRTDDGGKDGGAQRSDGGSPASRATNHAPDPYSPRSTQAAPRATSRTQPVTRHLNTAQPASVRSAGPGATAASRGSVRQAAPANFRTSSTVASHARAQAASRSAAEHHGAETRGDHLRAGGPSHASAGVRHAEATARSHHEAAAARHHRDVVARHHDNWVAHHRPATRWYRPRSWFVPWHPYGPHHWYHGVFVYGPAPWYHHDHVVVVDGDGAGPREEAQEAPERKVDRSRTFALGVRGGSYMGGYDNGAVFGDAGLGLAARYRPTEALGLELSWQNHDQTWSSDTERTYQPLQASVELFAWPWTKVNPYVLAGVTVTGRDVADDVGGTTVTTNDALWGPHAGVGLELGVGKKASVNFDVRWVGYLNKDAADLTTPGAALGNMGVNFYF